MLLAYCLESPQMQTSISSYMCNIQDCADEKCNLASFLVLLAQFLHTASYQKPEPGKAWE